jgi:chitodextrinase/peptidoglycan hydrolase-like protein with peptidoglycan-binding domain
VNVPSAPSEIPPSPSEATPPELTRSLSRGSSGDDVRRLQAFLAKDKEIYPNGLITGFFGPLTEAAVKKWQEKHNIESVGIVGPKTLARFQDIGRGVIQGLLREGAGASGVIPPGLLQAPGIQKKFEVSATTTLPTATTTPSGTIPATPAIPAVPSSGVGTVALPATPATPAVPAQTTTTTSSSPYGSALNLIGVTNLFEKIWGAPSVNAIIIGGGMNLTTNPDTSWAKQYGGLWVTPYSIKGIQSPYLTPTNPVPVMITGPAGSVIEVWNAESLKVIATNITSPGSSIIFTAQPNRRYGGFAWYADNSQKNIGIGAEYPLPAPTGLTASAVSSTKINLSWKTVYPLDSFPWLIGWDSPLVHGYYVYRDGIKVASTNAGEISFSDTNRAAGTTYSYTVAAVNAAGNGSTQSAPVSVTTPVSVFTPDTTAPSTILNLTSTALATNKITLVWSPSTDNVGVVGYTVFRNGGVIASTTSTTFDDLDILVPITTYSYTVKAWDAAGNVSAQSNQAAVLTLAASVDTSAPSIPAGLTATAISSSQINLSWSASTDNVWVTGYKVYRNGAYITTISTISYSDTGLSAGTSYSYAVAAYDASGNGSTQSSPVSATTLSQSLPAPTTLPAPSSILGSWGYSWSDIRDNNMGQRIVFKYPTDMSSKATIFRLYRKWPGDSAFSMAAEFSGVDSVACTGKSVVGEWILDYQQSSCGSPSIHRVKSGTTNPYVAGVSGFTASSYAVGEYSYYIAAVDASGKEGTPSATTKLIFLQPLTITSPTSAQSPTSLTPTFQWTNGSGWQTTPSLKVVVFEPNGSNPYWSSAYSSFSPTVYSGPALGSGKTYRASVYGIKVDTSTPGWSSYLALPASVTDFWISTTTSSLDLRIKSLAAISQSLNAIREQLLKLLQGL